MFPDNSPEPFSQYHSPGKGFYTQLIIEYSPLITIILKRTSAQFQLCRHFLVGQIALTVQYGTVSDRQILNPANIRSRLTMMRCAHSLLSVLSSLLLLWIWWHHKKELQKCSSFLFIYPYILFYIPYILLYTPPLYIPTITRPLRFRFSLSTCSVIQQYCCNGNIQLYLPQKRRHGGEIRI